jgi:hypothetical protein
MKSRSLPYIIGWGRRGSKTRPATWGAHTAQNRSPSNAVDDPESKWQKHIVVLLWVALALLLVLGTALIHAKGQGWFQPTPEHATPLPPPWPEGS